MERESKPFVGPSLEQVSEIVFRSTKRLLKNTPSSLGVGTYIKENDRNRQYAVFVVLDNPLSEEQVEALEKEITGVPIIYGFYQSI